MFKKIGKKLVQGAKAELDENPPEILNPNSLMETVTVIFGMGALIMMLFSRSRASKPMNIVINNYYLKK